MDEADRTFKWVCEKCGVCFEETDLGMLEVKQQTHKCHLTNEVELVYYDNNSSRRSK